MAINNIATGVRNTMCNGLVDAYDVGSANATGRIRIYTAGFALLLAELNFSNPAYGSSAVGVGTANAITDEASAPATGTAAVARWVDRDVATVHEGTVGTSGEDINLNTVSITTGDTVSITSATVTMPAG